MVETPNVLIVSDLHLSRGYYTPQASEARGGRFSDLEDFFCDEAFFTFVSHHIALGGRWQFVLNGDIADFLQVIDLPGEEEALETLRRVLRPGRDWARWKAKKILQAALQARPMYNFLSIRDVIFLSYTETGESVSWRKASRIMKLYEEVEAVKRNGHLKTKGQEIHLPKARAFLRS